MIKVYLKTIILLLTLSIAYESKSQSLELIYNGNIVNNDTIEIHGDVSLDTLSIYVYLGDTTYYHAYEVMAEIDIKNISTTSINVHCRKTYIHNIIGTENTFCWQNCYGPFTFQSANPVAIASESTLDIFSGHYKPKGQSGCPTIAYTFFNTANVSDSAIVYVNYVMGDCVENNIELENVKDVFFSNAYPNPANESFNIKCNKDFNKSLWLELIDTNGKIVLTYYFEGINESITINTSNIKPGLYLYRIRDKNLVYDQNKIFILPLN